MTTPRAAECADYVSARLPSFRRLAFVLCHDWHRADDLVQSAITRLYVNWQVSSVAFTRSRSPSGPYLASQFTIASSSAAHSGYQQWACSASLPMILMSSADRCFGPERSVGTSVNRVTSGYPVMLNCYHAVKGAFSGCPTGNCARERRRALDRPDRVRLAPGP